MNLKCNLKTEWVDEPFRKLTRLCISNILETRESTEETLNYSWSTMNMKLAHVFTSKTIRLFIYFFINENQVLKIILIWCTFEPNYKPLVNFVSRYRVYYFFQIHLSWLIQFTGWFGSHLFKNIIRAFTAQSNNCQARSLGAWRQSVYTCFI